MLTPFPTQLWTETLISHWEVNLFFSQYLDIIHHSTLNKDTDFYFRTLVPSFHRSFICYVYCVPVFVPVVGISAFLSLPTIVPHVKTPIPLQSS